MKIEIKLADLLFCSMAPESKAVASAAADRYKVASDELVALVTDQHNAKVDNKLRIFHKR